MKANELMIGDWVFCTYPSINKPVRVTEIKTVGDNKLKVVIYDDIRLVFNETYIDPIPLTAEILEKNGFECRGAWCLPGEDLGLRQDGDSWGLLSYYAEHDALAFCHIKYVHQLQHTLRLCGIEHEITL